MTYPKGIFYIMYVYTIFIIKNDKKKLIFLHGDFI